MKIIVDNGCYDLLNCGDASMLQILVDRLKELWPHAYIYVITDAPDRLKSICPGVYSIDPLCIESWRKVGPLSKSLFRIIPKTTKLLISIERLIWKLCPFLFRKIIKVKANRHDINVDFDNMEAFISTIFSAD